MKINILWLFVAGLILTSCEEDQSLNAIDELTVQAFLHAGEPVEYISFGKVIPLDSTEALAPPTNLMPVITKEGETAFDLFYTGEEGIYSNPEMIIEAGKTYELEVVYNGKTVSATTFIPPKPEKVALTDTATKRDKINEFFDILEQDIPNPIEVTWKGEPGAFYFVEVRNIESNPEVINELIEEAGIERPVFLTEPFTDPFYTIDVFQDITHYGTYEVTVYRVNPEYAALYEDNTSGTGSLNEVRTNVQNGFGIFTGINSVTTYFEVTR